MTTVTRLVLALAAGTGLALPAGLAGTDPAAAHPIVAARPVRQVTLTVRTVPALPGLRFRFDGEELRTDRNGRVTIRRPHDFGRHTLALVDSTVAIGDRRYTFARWAGQRDPDQAFRPTVTGLPMRASYTVTVAFGVRFPVTARYVDPQGAPINPARISQVKVKSDTGQLVGLPPSGTVWLDGLLPTYHKSVLANRPITYSLSALIVDGSNVVDAGRQKFQPVHQNAPVFKGGFYALTVQAVDAMFGDPIGTGAVVTYPDGSVHTVPFDAGRSVTLTNLARGHYKVSVTVGSGVVMPEELRLSRSRTVAVRVVSRASLILVFGTAGLLAGGLILIGRPRWGRHLLRGARKPFAAFRRSLRRRDRMEVPTP
jgi:hypothetical protein